MGIDSNSNDDNKLDWSHLEYPEDQYVWIGDLSGFEVVLHHDCLWLMHRCTWHMRLSISDGFLGNLVVYAKEHRQETCKEYMK